MSDVLLSAIYSFLFAFLEVAGLIFSKWNVSLRKVRRDRNRISAEVGLEFDNTSVKQGVDPLQELERRIEERIRSAAAAHLSRPLLDLIPGPELCFLALTIQGSVFIAWSFADESTRRAMSPLLHQSVIPYPILGGLMLFSIIAWISTTIWRDLLTEGLQKRHRGISFAAITVLGGGILASAIFLLIAGRS